MRLVELRLLNFRQHADTCIHIPPGLTGIIGPNGAGKSTLLEAIGWAIYGAEASRGTNDTLRHARAAATARVEVELAFELGGHLHRVLRTPGGAELRIDGGGVPVAATAAAVTEMLSARLGMDRREFFNTYFTGQKELQFLAAMGPAERGRFLSTVLGYDRLRVAQGMARERRNALRSRVEALRSGLPDADTVRRARLTADAAVEAAGREAAAADLALEAARERLRDAEPRWRDARISRERLVHLNGTADEAGRAAAEAGRDVARLEGELERVAAAEAELAALQERLAPLRDRIARYQRFEELARAEQRRGMLEEQVAGLAAELDRSAERMLRLEQAPELLLRYAAELQQLLPERERVAAALDERRTAWLRDRQDAETKLQSYRDRASELNAQIRGLRDVGASGNCPTCHRPLGGDVEALIVTLEDQLAEVTQDGRWWRSRVEQLATPSPEIGEHEEALAALDQRIADRSRRHARCEAAVQELGELGPDRGARQERLALLRVELEALPGGYDAAAHRALGDELGQMREQEQRVAALTEAVRRKEEWRTALEVSRSRRDQALAGEREAREEAAGLAIPGDAIEEIREAVEAAASRVRSAEIAAAGLAERLRSAQRDAAVARREEERLDRRLAELDTDVEDLRHHNELDSAFSRLRSELNAQVRPELGEIASALMAQLTDGRYSGVELDEAYRIRVLEDGLAKPVLSGGEEDVAHLVLRIALSRMIAERAGHPLSLLVLDEVFGSLDAVRRENVVRLLRRLGASFEQVLLVTHLEEVRGAMDQVLRVDLDEARGRSAVRWEGAGSEARERAGA